MQRQSNNFRPQLTDEESVSGYTCGASASGDSSRRQSTSIQKHTKVYKSIQKTTCRNGFPNCPAIKPFSDRLNRLAPAFQALAEYWLGIIGVDLAEHLDYIVDSCPIILAKGPRSGHARVASESCEKSYILLGSKS